MNNKSHVAGWTSESPTPAQLKEFFAQIESGKITRKDLQVFLRGKKQNPQNHIVGSAIIIPQLFDLASFIDGVWAVDEMNPRSKKLGNVKVSDLFFPTYQKSCETAIEGTVKLKRIKESGHTPLDVEHLMGLWMDYQANGKDSILEYLFQKQGITYLEFFGSIFRNPKNCRIVFCLFRDSSDGKWDCGSFWLTDERDTRSHPCCCTF